MNITDIANTAAIIEHMRDEYEDDRPTEDIEGLEGFKVIGSAYFGDQTKSKAVTLQDSEGNVFVHFYGTGDYNWKYNATVYGAEPQPSDMQVWAKNYFDDMMSNTFGGNPPGNVYVTGHSQGGNNAQFVTMRSEYRSEIDNCVSLDGPGFSHQFVDESKQLTGYEEQRSKIWGYNGEYDYVSCLGQEFIIPEGQSNSVKYTGADGDFMMYHLAGGLLENNEMTTVYGDSHFRETLIMILDKVKELPQEQQARAAELVMIICENQIGEGPFLTEEEFEELKQIVTPLLVEILNHDSKEIVDVLVGFGIDEKNAVLIAEYIGDFTSLPRGQQEIIVEAILDVVSFEEGKISMDTEAIPNSVLSVAVVAVASWWNGSKASIVEIGKEFSGKVFGKDILLDEEAFIKASEDLLALSGRLATLRTEVTAMMDTLKTGWDTPAGRKFYKSCNTVLLKPLDDQKLVLDHVSEVLAASKIQYESVFEAYENLNNTILSYSS